MYKTLTCTRSSTNHVDHEKKLNNSGMEHGGAYGAMLIKEHTKFAKICVSNSESITREGSLFFRFFLIFRPMNFGLENTAGRWLLLEAAKRFVKIGLVVRPFSCFVCFSFETNHFLVDLLFEIDTHCISNSLLVSFGFNSELNFKF